jgi:hypothetical protein
MALTPVLPSSIVRSGGVGYRPILPWRLMMFPGVLRPDERTLINTVYTELFNIS